MRPTRAQDRMIMKKNWDTFERLTSPFFQELKDRTRNDPDVTSRLLRQRLINSGLHPCPILITANLGKKLFSIQPMSPPAGLIAYFDVHYPKSVTKKGHVMKLWKSLKKADKAKCGDLYDIFLSKAKDLNAEYLAKRRDLEKEYTGKIMFKKAEKSK